MNNSNNTQLTKINEYIFAIYNKNAIVWYIKIWAYGPNFSQTCMI